MLSLKSVKLLCLAVLLVTCYLLPVTRSYAQETLTITTYYPSPTGSFNELQTNKLAVGDTNNDGNFNSADLPNRDGDLLLRRRTDNPTGWSAGISGQLAYSEFNNQLYYYKLGSGSGWTAVSGLWTLTGTNLHPNNNTWDVSTGTSFIVQAGGNVGIGTTAPGRRLVVKGIPTNSLHTALFVADNDWGVALGGFKNAAGGSETYGSIQSCNASGAAGNLVLQDIAGNVDIGTTTSPAALEVHGTIKAAGGLIIETRTNDPVAPEVGRIWLRTDIP